MICTLTALQSPSVKKCVKANTVPQELNQEIHSHAPDYSFRKHFSCNNIFVTITLRRRMVKVPMGNTRPPCINVVVFKHPVKTHVPPTMRTALVQKAPRKCVKRTKKPVRVEQSTQCYTVTRKQRRSNIP